MIGSRFGRLAVLARAPDAVSASGKRSVRFECLCDCGNTKIIRKDDLRSGNTRSCGCLQREDIRGRQTRHGWFGRPEHYIWITMRQRCNNPKNGGYYKYGARGIRVCERWENSFEAFIEDMGPRPSPLHTLDRYPDTNGNYEPGNVRWATPKEQADNRRNVIWVEHDGERMTAKDFADRVGVSPKRLYKVMSQRGLGPHEAAEYVKAHRRAQ